MYKWDKYLTASIQQNSIGSSWTHQQTSCQQTLSRKRHVYETRCQDCVTHNSIPRAYEQNKWVSLSSAEKSEFFRKGSWPLDKGNVIPVFPPYVYLLHKRHHLPQWLLQYMFIHFNTTRTTQVTVFCVFSAVYMQPRTNCTDQWTLYCLAFMYWFIVLVLSFFFFLFFFKLTFFLSHNFVTHFF